MRYTKQFDCIRGMAILIVVFYHWVPNSFLTKNLPLGFDLVDVFFVLSGFLITTILLQARDKAELKSLGKGKVFGYFYLRRVLRIFPIYYISILLVSFIDRIPKEEFIYLMTYTPNFYFFHTGVWDDHFSHLWSLGVEEQFYLLWPLVVLLFSRKSLPYVFIVFFLIGCATEYLLRENYFGYILPFTCFDSFGMGALFSWIMLYKPDSVKAFFKAASIVTALIFLAFLWELFSQTWTYIPARLTLSFFSLWLITHVIYSQSRDQKPFFLLNNKFLIYLGKISYGIYLFHLTLPFYSWFVFKPINEHLPVFLTKRNYFIRFENFCFLLVVASTSYYLIEMPINNLKRFIRLHKTSSRQDQAPGAEPLVYPPLEPSAELVLSKESLIKNEPTPSDSASSILRST